MSSSTIETIINSIVAISTVATLIVIWLTLKEMKTQRLKTYEPFLFPINFHFYLLSKYPNNYLPIICTTEKEMLHTSLDLESTIKIKNTGQGLAKNIKVQIDWDINFQKYFNTLKEELSKQKIYLKLDIDDVSCWLTTSPEDLILSGGNFPYQSQSTFKFDYLQPVRDSNEQIKIEIPRSIDLLLQLSILLFESYFDNTNKLRVYENLKDEFCLKITIEYRDNLDKLFTSNFRFQLTESRAEMNSSFTGKLYTIGIERI